MSRRICRLWTPLVKYDCRFRVCGLVFKLWTIQVFQLRVCGLFFLGCEWLRCLVGMIPRYPEPWRSRAYSLIAQSSDPSVKGNASTFQWRAMLWPFSEGQGSDPCPSMDAKPCALDDACWDVFVGCELTLLRRAGLGGTTTFARSRLMARLSLCSGTRPALRASKARTS